MREYVWLECTVCGSRNYRAEKETRGLEEPDPEESECPQTRYRETSTRTGHLKRRRERDLETGDWKELGDKNSRSRNSALSVIGRLKFQ